MDSRLKFLPRPDDAWTEGVTQKARCAGCWKTRSKDVGGGTRESRFLENPEI